MAAVTAIIPTLCTSARHDQLLRAIASLRGAAAQPPHILVVVNGPFFDRALLAELQQLAGVTVKQIPNACAPAAHLYGRQLVKTEFFCFLDDDDEYLPGAIDRRLLALRQSPDAALVVTNGLRRQRDASQTLMYGLLDAVADDPLAALFQENWLSSCGALYRTSAIRVDYFENFHDFIEWTWLAFKIALDGHPVCTLNLPTFVVHDTEGSASKSQAYLLAHISLLRRMKNAKPRPDIARILKVRECQAWHNASVRYLDRGDLRQAWQTHWHSLLHPHGWKFITYTRHLLGRSLIGSTR